VCEEVGCTENRECIAATNNVLAFCSTEGELPECQVPCQTDAECQFSGYDFMACVAQF
jgi:hypothetical protein